RAPSWIHLPERAHMSSHRLVNCWTWHGYPKWLIGLIMPHRRPLMRRLGWTHPSTRENKESNLDASSKVAVSVAEAAELVGLSRAGFYPLVLSGDVPSIKVGKRRLVPIAGLREWASRRSQSDVPN